MKARLLVIATVATFLIVSAPYIAYRTEQATHTRDTLGHPNGPDRTAFSQSRTTSQAGFPLHVTVTIAGTAGGAVFYPANITVSVGATITWVNPDASVHSVTSYNSTAPVRPLFDSGNLAYGQSFSYTFVKPGVYPYYCVYHDWMEGVVMVEGHSG